MKYSFLAEWAGHAHTVHIFAYCTERIPFERFLGCFIVGISVISWQDTGLPPVPKAFTLNDFLKYVICDYCNFFAISRFTYYTEDIPFNEFRKCPLAMVAISWTTNGYTDCTKGIPLNEFHIRSSTVVAISSTTNRFTECTEGIYFERSSQMRVILRTVPTSWQYAG